MAADGAADSSAQGQDSAEDSAPRAKRAKLAADVGDAAAKARWTRKADGSLDCPSLYGKSQQNFGLLESAEFFGSPAFQELLKALSQRIPGFWTRVSPSGWCDCQQASDFGCATCLGNLLLRCNCIREVPLKLRKCKNGAALDKVAKACKSVTLLQAYADLVGGGFKPIGSQRVLPKMAGGLVKRLREQGLDAVVKKHPEKNWELYIFKAGLLDKTLLSLFGDGAADSLKILYDLAEELAVRRHGEDGRGTIWAETLALWSPPTEEAATRRSLGDAVVAFAKGNTVGHCLETYDLARYTSGALYEHWKERQQEKYADFLKRMAAEERFLPGFDFCGPWVTGVLFGYAFWSSVALCVESNPFEEEAA
eukprot:TRINITY_DN45441_c0_g1_i1.p1 TRINITY_DN45441_c0_g1~~TRINITY_DN45441_c0_g1_i1.p1  ORF type:complete len:366 (-),score=104.36 TRINITY_DN45441_c0_g1_i1:129-1226(-)